MDVISVCGCADTRYLRVTPEATLIRALAEDLALEILASYDAEDFEAADFSSLGQAVIYLRDHDEGPGPALEELIVKVQSVQRADEITS